MGNVVSLVKRAGGGPHDIFPAHYRVRRSIQCGNGHQLMTFERSTLPEHEHEGVIQGKRRCELIGQNHGGEWSRIVLVCRHCPRQVQVSRARLEDELAALWEPYAVRTVTGPWD